MVFRDVTAMCYNAIATVAIKMAEFPVRVCSWEDISFSDAEQLLELSADVEQLQAALARCLAGGETCKGDKQSMIQLDLFTYAVLFCKKNGFSPEQLSAFFTILKSVHSMCIATAYDNLQDTFVYFRELLLRHSVQRPPFSVGLYSLAQVKAVTDYVLSTYFKHFKLYKYAFTKRVQLNLTFQYSGEPEAERGESKGEREGEGKEEGERVDGEEGDPPGLEEERGDPAVREEREEEQQELNPEQQKLRQIITSALNTHFKQLKVYICILGFNCII